MARKIRISELVRRIENGELTRKDYKTYFAPDLSGPAFQPRMKLKKGAVDARGLTATSEMAATLAHDAMQSIMEREADGAAIDAKVLAEGDSWFDLPWFYSSTIVDQLNQHFFPVEEIATPGDTIQNIIASGEYERALRQKSYKVFMFSAGGNDVLGDIRTHLMQRESGDNDAANAPRYVRSSFSAKLDEVSGLYADMVSSVARLAPRAKIVVHGYAYAIAQLRGPWLGSAFDDRGFHPVDQAPMCAAIVKAMVDAFNLRLEQLERANPNRVIRMDFRRDVRRNEWFDELHPRPAAARRMAGKIADAVGPLVS